jgi:hypothetical protein|eukprot:COSAG06_NODE_3523_length_5230_cov_3.686245_7_plen_107_part_00
MGTVAAELPSKVAGLPSSARTLIRPSSFAGRLGYAEDRTHSHPRSKTHRRLSFIPMPALAWCSAERSSTQGALSQRACGTCLWPASPLQTSQTSSCTLCMQRRAAN